MAGTINGVMDSKPKGLHPILITNSAGTDISPEEEDFKGTFRPRANTDPTSPRPRFHVKFDLPDIVVDDCSDNEESLVDDQTRELANTAEGAFFVFTSPPRQRSNTCPMNMFSRKKLNNRPPTPPPNDVKSRETIVRRSSKERVSFSPHKLTKVSEDGNQESSKTSSATVSDRRHSSPKTIPGRKTSDNTAPNLSPSTSSPIEAARRSRSIGIQRPVASRSNPTSDSPNASPKRSTIHKGGQQHNNGTNSTSRGSNTGHVIHSTA